MKLSKTSSNTQHFYQEELKKLKEAGNLRTLPEVIHDGKWVLSGEQRMLNLSSNDYLGLHRQRRCVMNFWEVQITATCSFHPLPHAC